MRMYKSTISLTFGIIGACLFAAAPRIYAEPYIAVRSGMKCSVCHVNKSGGGMRTDYGSVYSQYQLLLATAGGKKLPFSFDPKLNKSITVGANWRVEQVRISQYTNDSGKVFPSADESTIREGNLYLNLELVKNFLSLYIDQTMAPSSTNREFFATVEGPHNTFFKFGRMLLPYGLRLMDDEAFIRNTTNYTYNRHDLGYEVGWEPGPVSAIVNVTNTQLSSVGSVNFRRVRVGGSYGSAIQKLERDKKNTYGIFGGANAGMFTFLLERNWTKNVDIKSVSTLAEVNVLPIRGLNFKTTYEYLHPDTMIPRDQNGQQRYTFGAEPFLTQWFQIGLYYRKNDWIPQNGPKNQDQIIGRLHTFF